MHNWDTAPFPMRRIIPNLYGRKDTEPTTIPPPKFICRQCEDTGCAACKVQVAIPITTIPSEEGVYKVTRFTLTEEKRFSLYKNKCWHESHYSPQEAALITTEYTLAQAKLIFKTYSALQKLS